MPTRSVPGRQLEPATAIATAVAMLAIAGLTTAFTVATPRAAGATVRQLVPVHGQFITALLFGCTAIVST